MSGVDFAPAEQTDKKEEKKMKKKWRIKQNGQWFKIDKKCLKESDMLRTFYGSTYFEKHTLNISKTSILKMALRFCKKRGEIRTVYAHDQNLLRSKRKEFDSDFLQRIKDNHHDDDLFLDLIQAAGNLKIDSLFNLLFEEVFDIIFNRKTPEDVEKIYKIRCKNASHNQAVTILMRAAHWPLEKNVV
uniref:uncharacterized protein LOC122598319 n=1 Tax=Erigeron canadensis TaxID=72917 RepID=UPI001CB99C3B|nr:uncharacterized protein LOC122598319 [Erigeron canadensis]